MGNLHHIERRIDQASNSVDSTTFSTITNGTTTLQILPSELKAPRDYLVLACAQLKSASTANDARCRLVTVNEAGAFQSEFSGSRQSVEISEAGDSEPYFWFTRYRVEAGSNGLALQLSRDSTTGAVTAYHATLIVLDITEREWFFDEKIANTTLTTTFSTANNASVSFTPQSGQTWLLLSTQTFLTDGGTASQIEARADITAEPGKLYSSREGEKTTNRYVLSWARPITFGSGSQTMKVDARTTEAAQQHTRSYSAVFAMSLSVGSAAAKRFNFFKFDHKTTPAINDTAFYGTTGAEVDWQSGDYEKPADVIVLSMAKYTPQGLNRSMRLGVDNGSGTFYRTGTGTDAQPIGNPKDSSDEFAVFDLFLDTINNAPKQWDAKVSVDNSSSEIEDRFILVFSTAGYHAWTDAYNKIIFTIDEKSSWTEGELDTLDGTSAQVIKDFWSSQLFSTPSFTETPREHNSYFNLATIESNWELYPKVKCSVTNERDATLDEVMQAFVDNWVSIKNDIRDEVQLIRATTELTGFRYSDANGNRFWNPL